MGARAQTIPELLSPAADTQCLMAAIENGCDAVYIGGKNFSARKGAANFTQEELHSAIETCHIRGVRVYITVNTLYKQSELSELYSFIEDMYSAGADAFITADFGVARRIMQMFPGIEVHASTQMTVDSYEGAAFLRECGFSRVVLAREMPLDSVRKIAKELDISAEIFAHGALCYSYSGRCLMSGLIGGRSGNRGQCAQPCRLKYSLEHDGRAIKSGSLISMRDLNTLPMLRDIAQAGVACLKIEGRQKSAQYVAAATGTYRRALDLVASGGMGSADFAQISQDKDLLTRAFCRDGKFTQGYLMPRSADDGLICTRTNKHLGPVAGHVTKAWAVGEGTWLCEIKAAETLVPGDGLEAISVKGESVGTSVTVGVSADGSLQAAFGAKLTVGTPVHKSYDKAAMDALAATYNRPSRKLALSAEVRAKMGERISMALERGSVRVSREGEIVQPAKNSPVSREGILEKLSKTGDTPFRIEYTRHDIDDGIFMPISQINSLRRTVCEAFAQAHLGTFRRELPPDIRENGLDAFRMGEPTEAVCGESNPAAISVHTYNLEQLEAALSVGGVCRYTCQASPALLANLDALALRAFNVGAELYVALPQVGVSGYALAQMCQCIEGSAANGYVLANWGHFAATRHSGKKRIAGAQLGALNHITTRELRKYVETVTLSNELTLEEAALFSDASCEITIHGRHIAYIAKHCPVDCGGKQARPTDYCLVDRKGLRLPVMPNCELCHAVILNGQCLSMIDRLADLDRVNIGFWGLSFTNEPPGVVADVVHAYVSAVAAKQGQVARPGAELGDIAKRYYSEGFTRGYLYRGII
ncbi:MAG: DUF3656 domain-containing protein [Defluviitaleaceae bacterium]|nr:DUF3656 domain-containing protein [Defluviitaleaceae bacterium]